MIDTSHYRPIAAASRDEARDRNGSGLLPRIHAPSPPAFKLAAKPFVWRDPSLIPPRRWLYGHHYIGQYLSATVAPGGLGKSSLVLIEAVAMASGRPLIGQSPRRPLTVWYFNGEDPEDEIERRVAAIMLHHKVLPEEVEGRLFINSGRDNRDAPLIIAEKVADTVKVYKPVVDGLIVELKRVGADVLILDPFVSTHGVPENDNGAIDKVAKTLSGIADVTGVACEAVHHVRKQVSGQSEFTVEDARGAVALIGAVRSARVLNVMTTSEATQVGISDEDRRGFFRVDNGKANMRPPMAVAHWRRIRSVGLGNAQGDDEEDWVGVVEAWTMPGPFADVTIDHLRAVQARVSTGSWRDHEQSTSWVGRAVAEVLDLDADDKAARAKIKGLLKTWIKNGMLRRVERKDERRKMKMFVEVWRAGGVICLAPPRNCWWRKGGAVEHTHLLHHPPCKKGGGVEHRWCTGCRWRR